MGLSISRSGDDIMRKMLFLLFFSIAFSIQCGAVFSASDSNAPARPKRRTIKENLTKEQHRQRMRDLSARSRKERDKRRRERIEKMRKAQIEERNKNRKRPNVDRPPVVGGSHEQQLTAIDKKLSHETNKHQERLAKLKRMLELSEKKNSDKLISRIEKLLTKEEQRHSRKLRKMQSQKRRILRMGDRKRGGREGSVRPPVHKRPYDLKGTGPRKQNKTAVKPKK
jgi:hypothetical protein